MSYNNRLLLDAQCNDPVFVYIAKLSPSVFVLTPVLLPFQEYMGSPVPGALWQLWKLVGIASHFPSALLQLNLFKSAKLFTACLSSFQFPKLSCYYILPYCLPFFYLYISAYREHQFKTLLFSH